MLDVKFIVFVDGHQKQQEALLINTLRDQGFEPLVDGKHKTQKGWFTHNCVTPHLLFLQTGESYVYKEGETPFAPILGVFINNGDSDEETLKMLDKWVKLKLFDKGQDDSDLEEFDHSLARPQRAENLLMDEDEDKDDDDTYTFHYEYIEQDDWMLYEVGKPHTDKPYTTVTRNYTTQGHLPFFSSLFKCQSWGVSDKDVQFLHKVWSFLNMSGECDIEQLVKDRVEACKPGPAGKLPEAEPEVWRNDITNVLQILNHRKNGYIPLE